MTKRPRLKQGVTSVNILHMFSSALRLLVPPPLEAAFLIFPPPSPLLKLFHLRPLLHPLFCPPLVPLLYLLHLLLFPRKPPLDALSTFLLSSLARNPKGLDYLVRAPPQAALLDICPNSLTPTDPLGLPLSLQSVPHVDLIRHPLTKGRVLTKVNPKAKTSLPLIGLPLVRAPPKDSLKALRKDRTKALTKVSLGSTSQSLASWPSLVLHFLSIHFLLPAWAYCPARSTTSRLIIVLPYRLRAISSLQHFISCYFPYKAMSILLSGPAWAYCPARPSSPHSNVSSTRHFFFLLSFSSGAGPKRLHPKWQHLETQSGL